MSANRLSERALCINARVFPPRDINVGHPPRNTQTSKIDGISYQHHFCSVAGLPQTQAMSTDSTSVELVLKRPTANMMVIDGNLRMSMGITKKPAGASSPSAWRRGGSSLSPTRGTPTRSKRRVADRSVHHWQIGSGKNGVSLLESRMPRKGAVASRYIPANELCRPRSSRSRTTVRHTSLALSTVLSMPMKSLIRDLSRDGHMLWMSHCLGCKTRLKGCDDARAKDASARFPSTMRVPY